MLPSSIPSLSAVDSPVSPVTTSSRPAAERPEIRCPLAYDFDAGPPGPPTSRSFAEQPQGPGASIGFFRPPPVSRTAPGRSFHESLVFASSLVYSTPRTITVFADPADPTTSILAAMRIKTASIHNGIVVRMTLGGVDPVAFGLWLARTLHVSSALHFHSRIEALTTTVSSPLFRPALSPVAGPVIVSQARSAPSSDGDTLVYPGARGHWQSQRGRPLCEDSEIVHRCVCCDFWRLCD
ncbi:hypothetical protein C8F01DRAFT_1158140 [Mycena amicta]|nr:hypothetical protein C8F01DRAFT_1158140 [Mycena amicta]